MGKPCEFAYTCEFSQPECHEPRGMPPSIDELAKAVRALLVPRFAFDPQWAVACDLGRAALTRYEKEGGNNHD